ncbi:hypothetical protein J5N97_002080 [Dioscorea zingiberensis]|uniref:Endonuclease/exonuclease/phosphatase domain-containing protein n=1 Tax=Dioscorea zingiberensis TaxID=325984 RepID=A0A9D5BSV2_9LILI|nr:hypothetical protein J5N97_002080 [Dioscorea zingiberensis]
MHLNSFLVNNNLMELETIGNPFTWCNNQRGLTKIWAKLDRFFVNESWAESMVHYQVNRLSRSYSDHWPLLLDCSTQRSKYAKPFRFENHWIDYPQCRNNIENIWRTTNLSNPLHDLSHRIHNLQRDLIKKCRRTTNGIENQIRLTEQEIEKLEAKDCIRQLDVREWTKLKILNNKH